MRVLHLIPTLGQGGAERQLSILAPALKDEGIDVAVGIHTEGENLRPLENAGVKIFRLPARLNNSPLRYLDVARVVRCYRPDLVQTWLLQMDVFGGLVARNYRVPHILSERSSGELYHSGGIKFGIRAMIGSFAAAVVANSRGGADYWKSVNFRGELKIIPNAIGEYILPSTVPDFGLIGKRIIVAAGRFSFEKNYDVLIQALIDALLRLPDHHAVILGDGPDRSRFENYVHKSGMAKRIHFLGYVSDVRWWLRQAEVFVSASLMEGHPNVVIESAAERCPMVLSDIRAHRDFVGSEGALYANTAKYKDFSDAIVFCISDRESSINRVNFSFKLTENLSVQGAVSRYIELYRKTLAGDIRK